jgi:hypothetical protein
MPTFTNKELEEFDEIDRQEREERKQQQRIDRDSRYNRHNKSQPQPQPQSPLMQPEPLSMCEEMDELKCIELSLHEELKKQKNIECMLRKELDDNKRMRQNEVTVKKDLYDYLEKMFMMNKKHCPILHKFIIFIIYCITRIFLIFSDTLDTVLEYPIISAIMTGMTILYIYPENIITIIDMAIYIIDTGIFNNYINMFRTYLVSLKTM